MKTSTVNKKATETNAKARKQWAMRINAHYNRSVEAVLLMGNDLIAAKKSLAHGDFLEMVKNDLPFGARTAQRLMEIASNGFLLNTTQASDLPSSWTTLHLLSKVPEKTLHEKLDDGTLNPKITRAQVKALLPVNTKKKKDVEPLRQRERFVRDFGNAISLLKPLLASPSDLFAETGDAEQLDLLANFLKQVATKARARKLAEEKLRAQEIADTAGDKSSQKYRRYTSDAEIDAHKAAWCERHDCDSYPE